MTGLEIFKDVPILMEENCEEVLVVYEKQYRKAYYNELMDCVEVLKKKYKDVVTGLWFSIEIDLDGSTYFIFRTKEDITDTAFRGKIYSDICDLTECGYLYRMTNDSIEGLYSLPIDEWLEFNFIYAIYDTEKGIGL